jgi:hypothetical protein
MNNATLTTKVNQLQQFTMQKDVVNARVSQSPVAWHISHSLLVFNGVITQMQASTQADYKPTTSFKKFIVLLFGKFPRGKAKSPKAVNPTGNVTTADLDSQHDKAIEKIKAFENLQPNQFFNHPLFGHLNKATAAKFLTIHTNHHLAIIKDMVASK